MDPGSAQSVEIDSGHHTWLNGRRIIVVLETLELGGAERQAIRLAERLLHQYGAKVEVWGFADAGRAARLCDSAGIPWRLVRPNWGQYRFSQWMRAAATFAYLLRKAHAEILLPYCGRSNVICGLAWRLAGAKTCIWNQRDEGIGIDAASRPTQWAVRNTPAYVGNSKNSAAFLARTFGVPRERISIVHNGIELPPPVHNRIAWRHDLGVPQGTFLACMLANIHRNKDHVTLLKAWRVVLDNMQSHRQEAVLILAGWLHPEADEVKALARHLDLRDNVRFLGPVDDVSGLLSATDLGVFSSKSEGCPNGVLECMASGLPIAATDIPGIREAVGPAGLEYLAPIDDSVTFAQKILDLAHHPDQADSLGHANRERIRAKFSPDQMVHKMVTEISKAIDLRA
jgi:glycosyltransferase involved in cell wall biosynthesis